MREVRDHLPLDGEQLHDPVGHGVERGAGLLQLRRTVRFHPYVEVPRPQGQRGTLQAPGGADDPGAQPVGDQYRAAHQAEREQRHDAPRCPHAPGQIPAGHIRLDDRHPVLGEDDGLEIDPSLGGVERQRLPFAHRALQRLLRRVQRADEPAVREPYGELVVRAQARDRLLHIGGSGGQGEYRRESGRTLFGGGGHPVPGLFAYEQGERDEEGQRDHQRRGQGDPGEGASHEGEATSLIPIPRTVCR